MEDETVLVMLIQQYANQYGITFSSKHLDDPDKKAQYQIYKRHLIYLFLYF